MQRDIEARAEFLQECLIGLGLVDYLGVCFLRQFSSRTLGKRGDDLRIASLDKDIGQGRAEMTSPGNRQQMRLALGHSNFDESGDRIGQGAALRLRSRRRPHVVRCVIDRCEALAELEQHR